MATVYINFTDTKYKA